MKYKTLLMILFIPVILWGKYIPFDEAVKMLQKAEQKDYPNSNEVYLNNSRTFLNDDCTGYDVNESYRRILNEEGKSNNSVFFSENNIYDSLIVEEIKLIKADGSIIELDPEELLTKKDSPGWGNIYSNHDKFYTGSIPGLENGDIIYERSRTISKKVVMENNYFSMFSVESFSSRVSDHYEIDAPSDIELYIHELNRSGKDFEFETTEKNGRTLYSWSVKDCPKMLWERGSEDWNFIAHHFRITTVPDWETISRWYYNIVKPHMEPTREMKEKAFEIIEGASDRKEKAGRLFYWVAGSVRYLGVDKETNRPGFEPHDVSYTFETLGGVCRDKAALLTAMLRLVGIDSDVILISSGSRLNPEAPMVWFNHAITVSYDDEGEPEFIFDPTNETTKDFLPKYEEDNSYLIASKKGVTLRTTPVSPPSENNSTITIDLKMNGSDAVGNISYELTGLADTIFRSVFSRKNKHERESFITSMITGIYPDTEITDIENSDPEDKLNSISIYAKVKLNNYITERKGNIFIPFNVTDLNMHFLFRSIMSRFNLQERKFDFKMGGTYSMDTVFKLEFKNDPGDLSVPEVADLAYEGFTTDFSKRIEEKKFMMKYHFENDKIHYEQENYKPLKNKLISLSNNSRLYIIGVKGGKND